MINYWAEHKLALLLVKKSGLLSLQAHPLKRVLRCDKVILAGLEATLRLYLQTRKASETLPTLHLLTQSMDVLKEKAEQLKACFSKSFKKIIM